MGPKGRPGLQEGSQISFSLALQSSIRRYDADAVYRDMSLFRCLPTTHCGFASVSSAFVYCFVCEFNAYVFPVSCAMLGIGNLVILSLKWGHDPPMCCYPYPYLRSAH